MTERDALQSEIQSALHNMIVGPIIETIVESVTESGGDGIDMMVVLESIMFGVVVVAVEPKGFEEVVAHLERRVVERLAEHRLRLATAAGNA